MHAHIYKQIHLGTHSTPCRHAPSPYYSVAKRKFAVYTSKHYITNDRDRSILYVCRIIQTHTHAQKCEGLEFIRFWDTRIFGFDSLEWEDSHAKNDSVNLYTRPWCHLHQTNNSWQSVVDGDCTHRDRRGFISIKHTRLKSPYIASLIYYCDNRKPLTYGWLLVNGF